MQIVVIPPRTIQELNLNLEACMTQVHQANIAYQTKCIDSHKRDQLIARAHKEYIYTRHLIANLN